MFELGKQSRRQHLELGRRIAGYRLSALYLLGPQATQHVRRGALLGGMAAGNVFIGKDHADLARQLRRRVKRGDWLLLKGSRGMAMENIIERLKGRR